MSQFCINISLVFFAGRLLNFIAGGAVRLKGPKGACKEGVVVKWAFYQFC